MVAGKRGCASVPKSNILCDGAIVWGLSRGRISAIWISSDSSINSLVLRINRKVYYVVRLLVGSTQSVP